MCECVSVGVCVCVCVSELMSTALLTVAAALRLDGLKKCVFWGSALGCRTPKNHRRRNGVNFIGMYIKRP